jgi:superfamily II DNA helicase RecQ
MKELPPDTFEIFSKLRVCRLQVAKEHNVPAFHVFSDAELAEIARLKDGVTEQGVLSLPGIGEKRMETLSFRSIVMVLMRKTG